MSALLELAERVENAREGHAAALEAARVAQDHARKTGSELFEATRAWERATPEIIAALRTIPPATMVAPSTPTPAIDGMGRGDGG